MSIEVMQAPVISTAHVSEADAKRITEGLEDGSINGMQRNEGWLIHIETNLKDREYVKNTPSLVEALNYFKQYGFYWLMFDADASKVLGLPTYDW